MTALILASGSPRRLSLLQTAGVQISAVCPPDIDERRNPDEAPVPYARRMCSEKAAAVTATNAWVLAADTIVHFEGEILGKPGDDADADRALRALSGRWHQVTTGWCLRWAGPNPAPGPRRRYAGTRTTRVRFQTLSPAARAAYIATGEGRDKAGGYGIQGLGAGLVDRVVGCHTNVVGLPLPAVLKALHSAQLFCEQP